MNAKLERKRARLDPTPQQSGGRFLAGDELEHDDAEGDHRQAIERMSRSRPGSALYRKPSDKP
jgi:hypothetical protein